jgi:hypothetical protein
MDLGRIRASLNRDGASPAPPLVYEPTARLVYSDLGLPELFAHAAARGGLAAQLVHVEDLAAELVDHLRQQGINQVAMSTSPILRKVRLAAAVAERGVEVVGRAGAGLGHGVRCGRR